MIEQHRAQFILIALCTATSVAGLLTSIFSYDSVVVISALVGIVLFGGLTLASSYRLAWVNPTTLVLITLITCTVAVLDVQARQEFSPVVFIPPVVALILSRDRGIAISGIVAFAAPALTPLAVENPYLRPITLLIGVFLIMGMALGRIVLDSLIARSSAAEQAAHLAEQAALREATLAQERAAELEQKTHEQERLIELIGMLELPLVTLADGMILLPLVGHLDTRRIQAISAHLLEYISDQRVFTVIFDLAGIALIDTQVAQHLQRLFSAVGLLGAEVYLTGIRAEVAAMMTSLGIMLPTVRIARGPQEVIAQVGRGAAAG